MRTGSGTRARLRRLAFRVRALFHPDSIDRDLLDEMHTHVELEANDLMTTQGLSADEARRRALVGFGGVGRYREEHRDARGVRWIEEFALDLRYAVRSLARSPGFAAAAVAILALGIGATTAVFTGVNAVLLAHLPYPHDEQLVLVDQRDSPTHHWPLSLVDFLAVQSEHHTFSVVGAFRQSSAPVAAAGEPQNRQIAIVTAGFFQALELHPATGRLMDSTDNRVGAAPVVVVSHAFATEQYGSDAAATGRDLSIDGASYAIIGVLPAGAGRLGPMRTDIWPAAVLAAPTRRGPTPWHAVGRLADGVTLSTAHRNLAALSEQIFPIWKSSFQDSAAKLTPMPLRDAILGDASSTLGIFSAAVGLLLLLAVANVASLMLVRATGRQRELALRAVLGASRARLVRLVVTESVVLAIAGAAAGLIVGAIGLRVLVDIGPYVPRLAEAHLDMRAVGFTLAVALIAGAVVGGYPVFSLFRSGRSTATGTSRTVGATHEMHRVRGAFVVAEFALALPVLMGAGLLMTSFLRLQRVAPGFDPARIATVAVSLPAAAYTGDPAIASYWSRASEALQAIPGVTAVGAGGALPPDDQGNSTNNFDLVDRPVAPGTPQPTSPWPSVSNGFFTTMGLSLVEGRLFEATDTGTAPVIVVSRSWAAHYFPGEDAVGRQLISGGCTSCPRTTVVGVVADMKLDGLRGSSDEVYSPLTEGWYRTMHVFVRTGTTSDTQLRTIRASLQAVDPKSSLSDAAPMTRYVYESIAEPRNLSTLLGAFAVAALALAAIGIYGMLSYLVTARRREIGVRMALGAQSRSVVGMMMRGGMTHAVIGAALGLGVVVAGTRLLSGVLFQVGATDPGILLEVTAVLLGVAAVACWLPAQRASAIDPAEAIRAE